MPLEGHAFNPAIFRTQAGILCIYRYVGPDLERHIFCCLLDEEYRVVGEFYNWTDLARAYIGDIVRFADPRAFSWAGKTYITFNTGYSATQNDIYVAEVDSLLRPLAPISRMVKSQERRAVEKNWSFFDHDGDLYCLYSLSPFKVMRVALGYPDNHAHVEWSHDWYARHIERKYGPLNGGAPPVRIGDHYYVVFQSKDRRMVYRGSILKFEAKPPFAPVSVMTHHCFRLTEEESTLTPPFRLNPKIEQCLYPVGALYCEDSGNLTISYGVNDYRGAVRTYDLADIDAAMRPVSWPVVKEEADAAA
jgi:hypothetical protein